MGLGPTPSRAAGQTSEGDVSCHLHPVPTMRYACPDPQGRHLMAWGNRVQCPRSYGDTWPVTQVTVSLGGILEGRAAM